jgi:uncharacterized protein YdcH (DUF465 family)
MRRSRPIISQAQVERLERKHEELKARVRELDSRVHLTAAETVERQRLKKEKLAAKDALSELRGSYEP